MASTRPTDTNGSNQADISILMPMFKESTLNANNIKIIDCAKSATLFIYHNFFSFSNALFVSFSFLLDSLPYALFQWKKNTHIFICNSCSAITNGWLSEQNELREHIAQITNENRIHKYSCIRVHRYSSGFFFSFHLLFPLFTIAIRFDRGNGLQQCNRQKTNSIK